MEPQIKAWKAFVIRAAGAQPNYTFRVVPHVGFYLPCQYNMTIYVSVQWLSTHLPPALWAEYVTERLLGQGATE